MYTGDLDLNKWNAINIKLVAHFYHLSVLEKKCTDFILEITSFDTVFETFDSIYLIDNELSQHCLDVIQENTRIIFKRSQLNLFDMDLDAIRKVLELESLDIDSEMELFQELMFWLDAKRRTLVVGDRSYDATRKFIGEGIQRRFPLIRMASITDDEFEKCIQYLLSDFISIDELRALRQNAKVDAEVDIPKEVTVRLKIGFCDVHKLFKFMKCAMSRRHEFIFKIKCFRTFHLRGFMMVSGEIPASITINNSVEDCDTTFKMNDSRLMFNRSIRGIIGGIMLIKMVFSNSIFQIVYEPFEPSRQKNEERNIPFAFVSSEYDVRKNIIKLPIRSVYYAH